MDLAAFADTAKTVLSRLVRLDIAGLKRLLRVNALFDEDNIVANFVDMRSVFFHRDIPVSCGEPLVLDAQPILDEFEHEGRGFSRSVWQDERSVCSMVVLSNGVLIHEEYLRGTAADDLRISWSMSKSVLSAAFGTLDLPDLDTTIGEVVPSLRSSAYNGATIRNLLHMASGVAFNEDYLDYHSDINRMGRVLGVGGSMDEFARSMTEQAWAPGTYNHYVSIDTHVLGMVMRELTGERSDDIIRTRVLDPLGLERAPYFLTDREGEPFVLGGLNMTTRDYARFGQMICRNGRVGERQVVPEAWVTESTAASAPPPDPETAATPSGSTGYGYQWWIPPDPHPGEVMAVGIYSQNIYIRPDKDVVIAVNSADRGFDDGKGLVFLQNLAVYRQIADAL